MSLGLSSVFSAVKGLNGMVEFAQMRKDARLTFRVRSDLKKTLEAIAANENRSVAQICEAFLEEAVESYRSKGLRLVQRFVSQRRQKQSRH